MANDDHLTIKEGDKIEIHEGSWAGRTGKVIEPGPEKSRVQMDDTGEYEDVVNCTMGEYVEESHKTLWAGGHHGE